MTSSPGPRTFDSRGWTGRGPWTPLLELRVGRWLWLFVGRDLWTDRYATVLGVLLNRASPPGQIPWRFYRCWYHS